MRKQFHSKVRLDPCKGSLIRTATNWKPRVARAGSQPFLVISEDVRFSEALCLAGSELGREILQADNPVQALKLMKANRPAAILLDLDLPASAAWEIARRLLQEAGCPPLLFLTGRARAYGLGPASWAGTVVDKVSESPPLILDRARTLALAAFSEADNNITQRVLVRWLQPCAWPVPIGRSFRHWGINE